LLCEEFRKKQKRINPSSRAGASSSSCCKVLEVDFADQTATMGDGNGVQGWKPPKPPKNRISEIAVVRTGDGSPNYISGEENLDNCAW